VTPYYEDEAVTLYCGDCRDVLPTLQVAAIVTDPPYGISDAALMSVDPDGRRRAKRAGRANTWHPASEWDHGIDPEWCRLSCATAPIVAWCGHWRARLDIEAAMTWPIRCEIVWAKDMHTGPPCPLAMQDERIWIFSRAGIKPQRFDTTIWNVGVIPTWQYKHHKNEKPEGLMRRLLSWLPDGAICDPFAGSGTTLVAAKRLGRKAIGIELSPAYCDVIVSRLRQGSLLGATA